MRRKPRSQMLFYAFYLGLDFHKKKHFEIYWALPSRVQLIGLQLSQV
jgi:hypothetical protein